jgi:hypothetical protein
MDYDLARITGCLQEQATQISMAPELARAIRERGYSRCWVVDTEYRSFGNFPQARCLCALDLLSGERREVWLADADTSACPFDMTADELFLFFAADADILIWIAQGWTVPRHVIDIRVEFIRVRNGDRPFTQFDTSNLELVAEKETKADKKKRKKPGLYSLARICRAFQIPFISDEEKGDWRDLATRPGRNFSPVEQEGLILYCASIQARPQYSLFAFGRWPNSPTETHSTKPCSAAST